MKLSAVILAHKWDSRLKEALQSVDFANERLLIWDASSQENLPENLPDRVKLVKHELGGDFAAQRNFGLQKSRGEWVLFLDSDEQVSPLLAQQIKRLVNKDEANGYMMGRRDVFYGQEIKYGETGKIRLLRLGRKDKGKFSRQVHEIWKIRGRVGQIHAGLLHFRQSLVDGFMQRIIQYGPLDAKSLRREGKPFAYWRLLLNPTAKFVQNYFWRLGFLDGYLGLFHAYMMSIQSLSVRVFQKEKGN